MRYCSRTNFYQPKAEKTLTLLYCLFFFPLSTVSHLTINVTRSSSPQIITFDACLVIPCGDLQNQRQLASSEKYICRSKINSKSSHDPCMGAATLGIDPMRSFEMRFIAPPSPSSKQTPNDKTKVTIVEVKDLKQTLPTVTGYQDANAWVKWIKYSVHSLNKAIVMLMHMVNQSPRLSPFHSDGPPAAEA